ncbi:hypothetical protein PG999_011809 [Apiospora kogelbergensis]|uniref:Uncharacterized protein n=1 Tax=Apiospora kogelbergensis TaxID=1337665 RepID=A0AAW0QFL5_9PEZI
MQSQACLSLLGFISFVIGNFWVFEVKQSSRDVKAGIATYKFFNCPEVEAAPTWMQRDDVSGNKKGIRIVGSDILSPQIFEANVQHVHFSELAPFDRLWSFQPVGFALQLGSTESDWVLLQLQQSTRTVTTRYLTRTAMSTAFVSPPHGPAFICGDSDDIDGNSVFHCNSDYTVADMN